MNEFSNHNISVRTLKLFKKINNSTLKYKKQSCGETLVNGLGDEKRK